MSEKCIKRYVTEICKADYNEWITNYDPNKTEHTTDDGGIQGLNGRVFTAKNGNTLFIPAAGYYYSLEITGVGSSCYLCASNIHRSYPCYSYILYFSSNDIGTAFNDRRVGYPVCLVC